MGRWWSADLQGPGLAAWQVMVCGQNWGDVQDRTSRTQRLDLRAPGARLGAILMRKTARRRGSPQLCGGGLRHHPRLTSSWLSAIRPPRQKSYLREIQFSSVTRDQYWVPIGEGPSPGAFSPGPWPAPLGKSGWQGLHANFRRTRPSPASPGTSVLSLPSSSCIRGNASPASAGSSLGSLSPPQC